MGNELLRNGSGYVDFTAYSAIKNIERENERMEFKRGEIFEYEMLDRHEIKKALVVSADFRSNDRYISVILLIDEPKNDNCVPITTGGGIMYADCGMCSFAVNDRLGNYVRTVPSKEMEQVDEGIAKCLGIQQKKEPTTRALEMPVGAKNERVVEVADNTAEVAALKAELNVYKGLYESLLAKVVG